MDGNGGGGRTQRHVIMIIITICICTRNNNTRHNVIIKLVSTATVSGKDARHLGGGGKCWRNNGHSDAQRRSGPASGISAVYVENNGVRLKHRTIILTDDDNDDDEATGPHGRRPNRCCCRDIIIIVCNGFANYYAIDVYNVLWDSYAENVRVVRALLLLLLLLLFLFTGQWTRNPGRPKTIRKAAVRPTVVNAA